MMGDNSDVFLSYKMLHNKQCVVLYAIIMQKPLSLSPVMPLPPNFTVQRLQDLHAEMTSNTLSRQYELIVHKAINVKEFQELSDCPSYNEILANLLL
jgi:hypothetical protein